MSNFQSQKGQALLIVVLAMVVALTVGLSVVSRSITNLKNSQQEIDSQKALSAAEAGVELAIKNGANVGNPNFSTSTSYQTSLATVSGDTAFLLNGNNKVSKDDAMYIWLTPYSTDPSRLFQDTDASGQNDRWSGNLDLYWENSSVTCDVSGNDNNYAALEVAVVWGSRADPKVTRYVYDSCSNRVSQNHFTTPDSVNANNPISGITLQNEAKIPQITDGFLVRVVPLYADSYIGVLGTPVSGGLVLPSQGTIITSIGTTDNNITRKLDVFQGYPEIPAELFPFSLFWP
ncbi:MAG TPA: hypothetical protein VMR77_00775 [Patescibacteria group bacterium]|jgi:hypothetical protein|nr:hypothetical protein [Patescibacteria group bacterium]